MCKEATPNQDLIIRGSVFHKVIGNGIHCHTIANKNLLFAISI